jgi:hypothetical protein
METDWVLGQHETTRHGDILEKHEILHLIGQIRMKDERRQEAVADAGPACSELVRKYIKAFLVL